MWKTFGTVLLLLLVLSLPIYSVEVTQMSDEELWIELMTLLEMQSPNWEMLENELPILSTNLIGLNQNWAKYQTQLQATSNDLQTLSSELMTWDWRLQKVQSDIDESRKLLQSYEKDMKWQILKGTMIGVSIGIAGGVALILLLQ